MAVKKTTLMLDAAVYDALRAKAIARGQSVSALVTEAIRRFVSVPEPPAAPAPELPVVPIGRLLISPGAFNSNATREAFLDAIELAERGVEGLR